MQGGLSFPRSPVVFNTKTLKVSQIFIAKRFESRGLVDYFCASLAVYVKLCFSCTGLSY